MNLTLDNDFAVCALQYWSGSAASPDASWGLILWVKLSMACTLWDFLWDLAASAPITTEMSVQQLSSLHMYI